METYFVRSRGKLAGPFAIDALRQLVKRGKVSRFDQVSPDKASWRSAGDMSELFAPAAARQAPVAVADPAYDDGFGVIADGAYGQTPTAAPGVASFYYAQNGAAVGPVPLAVLQTLATNGTLRGDDPVWAEGSDIASPARQVPMLASYFSGKTRHPSAGGSAWRDEQADLPSSVRSTQFYSKLVYLIVAVVTLVFSLLPIAIFDGRAAWWWQGGGWMIAGTAYTIAACVALLIVAPLAAGLARPLVALALVGAPMVLGLIAAVVQAAEHRAGASDIVGIVSVWGLLVFPVLLSVMTRVRSRLSDGGPAGVRVINIVLGGLLAMASVGGVVLLCVAADNWTARPNATATAAYVCTWVGVLADLAAGVLAIVGGKPLFSRALNRATLACLIGAGGVYTVAVVIALLAFDRAFAVIPSGELGYVLFRTLVLLVASMMWLSAAFQETLAWVYRDAAAD